VTYRGLDDQLYVGGFRKTWQLLLVHSLTLSTTCSARNQQYLDLFVLFLMYSLFGCLFVSMDITVDSQFNHIFVYSVAIFDETSAFSRVCKTETNERC